MTYNLHAPHGYTSTGLIKKKSHSEKYIKSQRILWKFLYKCSNRIDIQIPMNGTISYSPRRFADNTNKELCFTPGVKFKDWNQWLNSKLEIHRGIIKLKKTRKSKIYHVKMRNFHNTPLNYEIASIEEINEAVKTLRVFTIIKRSILR